MSQAGTLLRHLNELLEGELAREQSDGELVRRFAASGEESAFALLVRRHGRRVWGVCRRLLGHEQEAEDAFQATFLVLARQAPAIRKHDSVASWLYGTAYRIAVRARQQAHARREHERRAAHRPPKPATDELTWRELQIILEEELQRLPSKYRMPFVLCCLEEKSRTEAARELGWKEGTLSSRLAQARKQLQVRLGRRGIALSAAIATLSVAESGAQAAIPAALARATLRLALSTATGGALTANVAALVHGASRAAALTKVKLMTAVALGFALLAAGTGTLASLTPGDSGKPVAAPARKIDPPPAEVPKLTDRYGDPLPEGALLRLGTERFRQGNFIYGMAVSSDGRTVVTIGGNRVAHVWDTATGRERRKFERPAKFGTSYVVAISPDGRILADGGQNGVVTWDLTTGQDLYELRIPNVFGLAFSPDGTTLATGNELGGIYFCDATTGQQQVVLREPGGNAEDPREIGALVFSPDGRFLAAGRPSKLDIWDVSSHKAIRQLAGHYNQIVALAFSTDGKTIASGSLDGDVRLWDAASGKLLHWLRGHEAPIACLALTPDGKTLVSGSGQPPHRGMRHERNALRLWDLTSGKQIAALDEYAFGVTGVAVTPDGKTLFAAGGGGSIRIWDLATRQEVQQRDGHHCWIGAVAYAPDGSTIVTGDGDSVIRVWEVASGKEVRQIRGCNRGIDSLVFSPDGKLLASGSRDSIARIWDFASGKELHRLQCSHGSDTRVAFSPNGRLLASGTRNPTRDDTIKIWDVESGKELHHFAGPKWESVWCLGFAPDGKSLASGGGSEMKRENEGNEVSMRFWEVGQWREIGQFRSTTAGLWTQSLAFSPDGSLVASSHWGGGIRLWDVPSRKQIRQFDTQLHTGKLAFSPDGHTVASASYDNTVRFWEVATGRERRRYTGSGGTFTELAYAPDGCTVAAGSMDTTTVIFDTVGAKARQARTTPFSLADLATLWNDLASGDAHRAYEPLQVLAARPEQTLPFLSQQLQPFDPQRLDKIITDLDSDQFPIRDQATRELSNSAEQAEPALRRALTRQPSLELRRRAEGLLTQAEARAPRVTELLELIGSAEAQQMIEKLAQGQAEARLAQEAKDSLQRLKRIAALKTLHKKQ